MVRRLHTNGSFTRREDRSYLLHGDLHADYSTPRIEVPKVLTPCERDLGIIGVLPQKAQARFFGDSAGDDFFSDLLININGWFQGLHQCHPK